jgi:hypothetical protein
LFKRSNPVEKHWGILNSAGAPKLASAVVCAGPDEAVLTPEASPSQAAPSPTAQPPPLASPLSSPSPAVLDTRSLSYHDFDTDRVCTHDDNYCSYANRPGKAIIYGSMTALIAVPADAQRLDIEIAIPCNGWGEGLAGPAGSRVRVTLDGQANDELIDASMPFHHDAHYRYEFCEKLSNSFSVTGETEVTLTIEAINGARLDFQGATLVFRP